MEEGHKPPQTSALASGLRIFIVVGLVVIAACVAFTMKERQRLQDSLDALKPVRSGAPASVVVNPPEPSKAPPALQVLSLKESKTPGQRPPDGLPIALDESTGHLWLLSNGYLLHRWNPRTGETVTLQLAENYVLRDRRLRPAATPDGIYFPNGSGYALLTTGKAVITATSRVQRYECTLLALRDHSVLAFGGQTRTVSATPDVRDIEHVIYRDGSLTVAPLPDLPGPAQRGTTLVQLADGRLMALGGRVEASDAAGELSDATWFLDLAAGSGWTEGPKLNVARASATATLLPDGRILVAGGWVKGDEHSHRATRSTELWDPSANRFVEGPLLAIAVAEHQARWVPGEQNRQLLLTGGRGAYRMQMRSNWTLQAYDVAHSLWRDVGVAQAEAPWDNEPASVVVRNDKSSRVWIRSFSEGLEGSWIKVAPRVPTETDSGAQPIDGELRLLRKGIAFLAPGADAPGISVGGMSSSSGASSAAADLLWSDGRIQALPVLRYERAGAQVFRLRRDVFIVVGVPPLQPDQNAPPLPPAEWFRIGAASTPGHWEALDLGESECLVWGPAPDASLLCLKATGEVERVVVENLDSDAPTVRHVSLPPLKHARFATAGAPLLVKGLPDGRIVVAGGEIEGRIARLSETSLKNDATDEYVAHDAEPARTYEIYDPAAKRWHESVVPHGVSRAVTIFDDGRVAQWGYAQEQVFEPVDRDAADIERFEIGDVSRWQDMPVPGLPIDTSAVALYTTPLGDTSQLFLAESNENRGESAVLWLDPATRKWNTLWKETREYEPAAGLILIRTLPGVGRVVLPVPGM